MSVTCRACGGPGPCDCVNRNLQPADAFRVDYAVECPTCFALTTPERADDHQQWHDLPAAR